MSVFAWVCQLQLRCDVILHVTLVVRSMQITPFSFTSLRFSRTLRNCLWESLPFKMAMSIQLSSPPQACFPREVVLERASQHRDQKGKIPSTRFASAE